MRKTIEVSLVKERANQMLANSKPEMTKEREGIICMIENILHISDNYKGFNYIGGYVKGMDETRRYYY